MFDGMNSEESLEVIEIQKQCIKFNHKQVYALIKGFAWDLRRWIDYAADKEVEKNKKENYKKCYNCGSWIRKKFTKCVCGNELK
jgi:hypothetical protein